MLQTILCRTGLSLMMALYGVASTVYNNYNYNYILYVYIAYALYKFVRHLCYFRVFVQLMSVTCTCISKANIVHVPDIGKFTYYHNTSIDYSVLCEYSTLYFECATQYYTLVLIIYKYKENSHIAMIDYITK